VIVFRIRTGWRLLPAALGFLACATPLPAQTAASPSSPDVPSIKVGVLIFADYTVVEAPRVVDANGDRVRFDAFQIGRAYINVTGNISKTIVFRLTPDVVRDTVAGGAASGSSVTGSYVYRLKYAYAQWNLDPHLTPGSFVRLGLQQSPWIDMVDTVYRYRFQGPVFEDREGYLSPADAGATMRYVIAHDYGDVHAGFFNGENYQHPEVNDRKGFQIRGSLRPLPAHGALRGLRVTAFRTQDAYVKNGERTRTIGAVTFEHAHVHAGFDYLKAADRPSAAARSVHARGWTAFVTPISGHGWEALLRVDHLVPDLARPEQSKHRSIAGVSYWFPHQGSVATAVMLDVDVVNYRNYTDGRPDERRIAVHSMVSF
jgi:hypothetical protein